MDGERFDDLVRWLETGRSRRALTRLLGGGALLAPLGAWGFSDGAAKGKGKGKGKKKPRKKQVCLCSASGCTGQKVKKRSKFISQNAPCAYAGGCTTNPCAAGATPPPPPGCTPEPQATTCARGCGPRTNNCNQTITCPCPSGQNCLPNGTCARPCTDNPDCAGCADLPAFELCSGASSEGPKYCGAAPFACNQTQPCNPANTTGCPRGFVCIPGCGCVGIAVCPPS